MEKELEDMDTTNPYVKELHHEVMGSVKVSLDYIQLMDITHFGAFTSSFLNKMLSHSQHPLFNKNHCTIFRVHHH